MSILFLGCYINNINSYINIGDSMYRDVFKYYFKNYKTDFIHTHQLSHSNNYDNILKKCDLVVLGGGGILYDRNDMFYQMNIIYEKLKKYKKKYCFISIGLQFKGYHMNPLDNKLNETYIKIIEDAELITVRSNYDLDIVKQYNANSYYYPDLIYNILDIKMINKIESPKYKTNIISIGKIEKLKPYLNKIKILVNEHKFNYYHIEFSEDDKFDYNEFNKYELKPIIIKKKKIIELYEIFNNCRFCFSVRYHGYLMADLCKVNHNILLNLSTKLINYEPNNGESINHLKLIETFL